MSRALAMLEDKLLPGASIVNDLRASMEGPERLMRAELRPVLGLLGPRVQGAAEHVGGLLMEVKRETTAEEEDRVATILAHAGLERFGVEHLKRLLERQWGRQARITMQTLEKHEIFLLNQNRIAQRMMEQGGLRTGLIDLKKEARNSLMVLLNLAREEGWGINKTSRLIEHFVPAGRFVHAGVRYRAQMIARTETLSAQRFASLEAYMQSSLIGEVIAFDGTEHDDRCRERNGKHFTLDEAMMEAGNTHPQCVLTFAPVTK